MCERVLFMAACIWLSASTAAGDCVRITDGLVVAGAVWSPDGSTLAFHAGTDIYTVPATGGPVTHVIENAQWPTWSPDGARLAFARAVPPAVWDIWVIDLQTGGLRQITTWSGYDTYPDWSHDGDKIAYSSRRDYRDALYVYSFSTGLHSQLAAFEGVEVRFPDWSPDDDRIVVESQLYLEGPDIFLVDYPSGTQQHLLGPPGGFRQASWHPSGESLILIGLDDVGPNSCVVSYALPSGPRLDLLCAATGLSYPEWAPGGSRYSVVRAGDLTICDLATAVGDETWGALKRRFRGGGE